MSEYTHFIPLVVGQLPFFEPGVIPPSAIPIEYLALWRMFREEDVIKPVIDPACMFYPLKSFK